MLIITKKMQRNTPFFISVEAVYVSGGFSAHHQELKNCTDAVCTVFELLIMGGETA
jgi:hypothetical protein